MKEGEKGSFKTEYLETFYKRRVKARYGVGREKNNGGFRKNP
jgi:hypothetical protein